MPKKTKKSTSAGRPITRAAPRGSKKAHKTKTSSLLASAKPKTKPKIHRRSGPTIDRFFIKLRPFPFLDLPHEIRTMIYRLSLVKERKLLLAHGIPPLLQVCKQIREETLKVYYAENGFGMLVMNMQFFPFYSWVQEQEPSVLNHLHRLTFYFIGFEGWSAAHQLLRVQEEDLNLSIQLDFAGQYDMFQAYKNAFALVSMLRKTGLSWDQLADVTKYAQEMMGACRMDDEWHGLDWDEEFIEDMQDDFEMSSRIVLDKELARKMGI